MPKARAAAAKALEIDETIAEAHASLGFVKFWYDWDFAGAETEYRRAIQLNPNYSTARHWYGEFLVLTGRAEDGFRELALAQQIARFHLSSTPTSEKCSSSPANRIARSTN